MTLEKAMNKAINFYKRNKKAQIKEVKVLGISETKLKTISNVIFDIIDENDFITEISITVYGKMYVLKQI